MSAGESTSDFHESSSDRVETEASRKARELWEKTRLLEEPARPLNAPHLPASPGSLFGCTEKRQVLDGARCLALQAGDPNSETNLNRYCASGLCLQGKKVSAVLDRMKVARLCSKCGRTQLGESNTDGLCAKCRPAPVVAPAPLPKLSTPYLNPKPVPMRERAPEPLVTRAEKHAARSAEIAAAVERSRVRVEAPAPVLRRQEPIPPTPATPATTQEKPMAEKRMCTRCNGVEFGSANKSGACTPCQQGWSAKRRAEAGYGPPAGSQTKPASSAPASKPARAPAAEPVQAELPATPAAVDLPELASVPNTYLIAAVRELRRRMAELQSVARELGFAAE